MNDNITNKIIEIKKLEKQVNDEKIKDIVNKLKKLRQSDKKEDIKNYLKKISFLSDDEFDLIWNNAQKNNEITWECGKVCPKCKKGRIMLGSIMTNNITLDQEPYEADKIERDGEEFLMSDCINLSVYVCDSCREPIGTCLQNNIDEVR